MLFIMFSVKAPDAAVYINALHSLYTWFKKKKGKKEYHINKNDVIKYL